MCCVTALPATRRRHWMMSRQVKACMCSWSIGSETPAVDTSLAAALLLPCWCWRVMLPGTTPFFPPILLSSSPQAAALLDSAADFQVGPLHHPAVLLLPGPRLPLDRLGHWLHKLPRLLRINGPTSHRPSPNATFSAERIPCCQSGASH